MKDKFGIEIQLGDILACVNMAQVNTSPFLAVVIGFTPQKVRMNNLNIWRLDLNMVENSLDNPNNFVIVNREQIDALCIRIFENRERNNFNRKTETLQYVINFIETEIIQVSERIKLQNGLQ